MQDVMLKIDDLLSFVDWHGVDALDSDRVADLIECVEACHYSANNGEELVADAVYDRLVEILRLAAPDSDAAKYIWDKDTGEGMVDLDILFKQHPMYSIQTCKSKDCAEFAAFIDRLPYARAINFHASLKLNGHGIRIIYQDGKFVRARSRARSSAGRDITRQLTVVLDKQGLLEVPSLACTDLCEVRGELVLPLANFDTAKKYNPAIKSAFTGVSSMLRDSATEEEWGLLHFVAYEFLAEGNEFDSKTQEYEFLDDIGFETPGFLTLDCTSEDIYDDVDDLLADMRANFDEVYFTDGVVLSVDDVSLFQSLGDDGAHYKFGNVALKFGQWKQDTYPGYVQCILYTRGKTKFSPVAVVASEPNILRKVDEYNTDSYLFSKSQIANWDELGVVTANGSRVRKVPLYEPANILALDAYPGCTLSFKFGGEAGVVPCYPDGTPLVDGRVKQVLEGETYDED